MSPLIVIFGAAVRPDGEASPALLRRVRYGAAAAAIWPDAPLLCSGAQRRFGGSEASVMAAWLTAAGIAPERLILDEDSRDTLQNVLAAARVVRARGLRRCVICSDGYHLPRIRLLLAVLGVRSQSGPVPHGPAGSGWRTWLWMSAREVPATAFDLVLALGKRRALQR